MRRAALVVVALAACGGAPRATTVSLPEPLPSPPPVTLERVATEPKPAPDTADFASERGAVHLTREPGGLASGTFGSDGVLACTVAGDRFDCTWYDGTRQGHATLLRDASGRLTGTWGNDASATDGGAWTLSPVPTSGLEGLWSTNFGRAIVRATAEGFHVEYRDGTMECERRGAQGLDCAWTEGASTGRASFTIESPRVVRGTWGNGASATDGGAWLFVRP